MTRVLLLVLIFCSAASRSGLVIEPSSMPQSGRILRLEVERPLTSHVFDTLGFKERLD